MTAVRRMHIYGSSTFLRIQICWDDWRRHGLDDKWGAGDQQKFLRLTVEDVSLSWSCQTIKIRILFLFVLILWGYC